MVDYYSPAHVARLTKLPPSTLNYYARYFAEYLSPKEGHSRIYTRADIEIFMQIKKLRWDRTPLEKIGSMLVQPTIEDPNDQEPQEHLEPRAVVISTRRLEETQQLALNTKAALESFAEGLAELRAQVSRLDTENQEFKKYLSLPWYKRIFNTPPGKG